MISKVKTRDGLGIYKESHFLGHPLLYSDSGLIYEYLYQTYKVLNRATEDHPRTWAVRVDLRLPRNKKYSEKIISKFTNSLKAKLKADAIRKNKKGQRTHACTLRFIWTKERDSSIENHYHVLLLFNKDAYWQLGDYAATEGHMSAKIKSAWASALGLGFHEAKRLIYYPENCNYYLNRNNPNYQSDFDELFKRVSYFAKIRTKVYENRKRCFGYSLK